MQRKHLLVPALLALAITAWIFRENRHRGNFEGTTTPGGTPQSVASPSTVAGGEASSARKPAELPLGDEITSAFDALNASDASITKASLDALAQRLKLAPGNEATNAIRIFLDGRRNASTLLPFTVGDGGNLATAPTFRVWLLDQLSRTNPEAAADYAGTVLARRDNAEEWAVALRDFARVRTTPDNIAYLNGKMRELLNEPQWQKEQSAGWLEAFDVAVHNRAVELTPDLTQLLTRTERKDKPAAYAAFITLDRLVQAAPVEMMSRLQAEPDLMKGRELTRANYFSRANVSEPRQREIVERYLLDAGRSQEELAKFAGLYPNANAMISKNLLTPAETPSRDELTFRDREALKVVTEWLNDPRFSAIRPHIGAIHTRLSDFVRQAGN